MSSVVRCINSEFEARKLIYPGTLNERPDLTTDH